ncbi:Kinesin-like protein KIN-14L [Glycine max]|nr:Kinesin-like protein KIN-14L [Glycine max]
MDFKWLRSGKTYTMSGPLGGVTSKDIGVNCLALHDLFQMSNERNDIISYHIYVQMVEIYNEQSPTDVMTLMKLGQVNRVVCSTSMNNRSSCSMGLNLNIVHVNGKDLLGSSIHNCLHLVARSERVDECEVTGERLKGSTIY